MYVRSLSLHTTLYRYFVNQASEEKLAVHIGFVNLYMELPLIAVFQISWEKQKMTIHIGFVNSLHKKSLMKKFIFCAVICARWLFMIMILDETRCK